jgi:ankyrin repeat protein
MIRLLLPHHPPIDNDDNDYKSTPLHWAMYGSQNGWHQEAGDYANTVEALLDAGASLPRQIGGTDAVKAAFRRLRTK